MDYLKITMSMTTCKRFDLFEKTIKSFTECCKDLDLIEEIIIIDDGSNFEDIQKMKKTLSDLELNAFIYGKPENEKGHYSSMNTIFNSVKTDYLLHLEDDWLFTKSDNFIKKAFDIMAYDNEIKQVLFRINPDIMAVNQIPLKLNNIEYVKYDYNVKSKDRQNRPAWSGWNLNPSLMNLKDIKGKIGIFNNVWGFEYNYSMRYAASGFKTAYFTENYCEHIGKGNSAYKLNDTAR